MPAIFPASTKGGGQCLAFPNVCKVPAPPAPPIPMPFPSIGQPAQAKKTATKVKFAKKEVVTKKSEIPRSSGDEAGTLKGLISSTNMGKVTYKKASAKVKAQGQPVAYLTSMTAHNGAMNANTPAGAQLQASQTKVRVSP